MIWFTSDQHFGHENIIKYCNRPFSSAEAMNVELMRRHNVVVGVRDLVYHLGDFSMHPRELHRLKDLNGEHHLIAGNHDRCHPVHKGWEKAKKFYLDAGFKSVDFSEQHRLPNDEDVVLHHLPYTGDHHDSEERYAEWRPIDMGLWLFHGHVHTTWKKRDRMINVGVDQWAYAPVSLDEILDFMFPKENSK